MTAQPEHALARAVYDDQGRYFPLGLSEAEVRLECLRLAMQRQSTSATEVVSDAAMMSVFVLGIGAVKMTVEEGGCFRFDLTGLMTPEGV